MLDLALKKGHIVIVEGIAEEYRDMAESKFIDPNYSYRISHINEKKGKI